MGTTEEDLEQKRSHLDSLREQIAVEEAKAAQATVEYNNNAEAELLDQETARLEARLTAAREAAKNVGAVATPGEAAAANENLRQAREAASVIKTTEAPASVQDKKE